MVILSQSLNCLQKLDNPEAEARLLIVWICPEHRLHRVGTCLKTPSREKLLYGRRIISRSEVQDPRHDYTQKNEDFPEHGCLPVEDTRLRFFRVSQPQTAWSNHCSVSTEIKVNPRALQRPSYSSAPPKSAAPAVDLSANIHSSSGIGGSASESAASSSSRTALPSSSSHSSGQ